MLDAPYTLLLGIAQDAGHPQVGCYKPCCKPAWEDPKLGHFACCLAIVDPAHNQRWLIDVTPDFPQQLRLLDQICPSAEKPPGLDGILLTHAHIGHFTGLMYLGREVLGARNVPTFAMPRMTQFLKTSGPWDLLCRLKNIVLSPLTDGESIALNDRISVRPFLVPHRGEYTETIGVEITGPTKRVLYLPDIDRWPNQEPSIERRIASVDRAYLDGTFFDTEELPGRAMSEIPHPLVRQTLARFKTLSAADRDKIHLFHLNHTNPLLWVNAPEHDQVRDAGLHVAQRGDRFTL